MFIWFVQSNVEAKNEQWISELKSAIHILRNVINWWVNNEFRSESSVMRASVVWELQVAESMFLIYKLDFLFAEWSGFNAFKVTINE